MDLRISAEMLFQSERMAILEMQMSFVMQRLRALECGAGTADGRNVHGQPRTHIHVCPTCEYSTLACRCQASAQAMAPAAEAAPTVVTTAGVSVAMMDTSNTTKPSAVDATPPAEPAAAAIASPSWAQIAEQAESSNSSDRSSESDWTQIDRRADERSMRLIKDLQLNAFRKHARRGETAVQFFDSLGIELPNAMVEVELDGYYGRWRACFSPNATTYVDADASIGAWWSNFDTQEEAREYVTRSLIASMRQHEPSMPYFLCEFPPADAPNPYSQVVNALRDRRLGGVFDQSKIRERSERDKWALMYGSVVLGRGKGSDATREGAARNCLQRLNEGVRALSKLSGRQLVARGFTDVEK